MGKISNTCVACGFTVLLAGTAGFSVLWPQKGFSQEENRYLQKTPQLTMESLLDGSFGEAYETSLSDQFPYRNQWVGMKVMAERVQGKADVSGVYFGKDQYLIEKFESEDLQIPQADENITALANALGQWEQQLGSEHVRAMLVPSASQILKEKLPFLAAPYDQNQIVDMLMNKLENQGLLVAVQDQLANHRQEALYYRTDHHWTSLGAYYGYTAWAESIGITPMSQAEFSVETVSRNFLGTIQSKLNISVPPDSIQIYEPRQPARYEVYYDLAETSSDSLYNLDSLNTKDQYRVYLDGNHALTKIDNQHVEGEKLLIIKDSFAHTFAPFAVNHFETTYLLDLRYYNGSISDFITAEGITDLLVLYQIPGFCGERSVGKIVR